MNYLCWLIIMAISDATNYQSIMVMEEGVSRTFSGVNVGKLLVSNLDN